MNKKNLLLVAIGFTLMTLLSASPGFSKEITVIAHRGASGYLPEHTIAAKAMSYAMGADYIEQDVVMTRDNELVVLHDHFLDRVSDVQEKYPDRKRSDGRYYVIDFSLEEIRGLNISERYSIEDGKKIPVFPERFPMNRSYFKVHTLAEEIELIQGLNKSNGKDVGIYTEVKSAGFHLKEGKDISRAVLTQLKKYGYENKSHKVYYQSFEIEELKRVYSELEPALSMNIKLVQLMGVDDYYDEVITAKGLKQLSTYVDGIGPDIGMIVDNNSVEGKLQITNLVKDAQKYGLEVHPYTFRQESFAMPSYANSYEALLEVFINQIGVDGVFTDFTDRTVNFIQDQKDSGHR